MSLTGLLNQTITIYPITGYSDDGRESVSAGVSAKARFQATSKRNLQPKFIDGKSTVVEVNAIAYVPADTVVEEDYKVSYSGVDYKVVTKYAVPGANGVTDHIKLELQKWQST